jgi:hypothetical protein
MAVIRNTGLTKMMVFQVPASTAVSANSFVKFDGSGNVINSVSGDATVLGVYNGPAISNSQNAAAAPILVEVPIEKAVEFVVDVENGSATQALVGTTCDLNDATGINVSGTSHNAVTITRFISATKVAVVLKAVLI